MRAPHDWNAIAAHALDLLPSPTAVIDGDGLVRGWNAALENLAGRPRREVIGRSWVEVRGDVDDPRSEPLEQAIAKGRREATSLLRTADDRRLSLRLAISRLGEGKGQLAIVTIVAHHPADAAAAATGGDLTYEVSAVYADRWMLRGARGRAVDGKAREGLCYEALQRRSSPCPGCPAIAITPGETRSAVIPSGNGHEPVRLVAARGEDGVVRLHSWDVDDPTLWALVETKVKLLAARSDLSAREQDVLLWLLRGRTPQDVATLLGIAPRTVKFHQANVLRKLGAESRADLLRLIF